MEVIGGAEKYLAVCRTCFFAEHVVHGAHSSAGVSELMLAGPADAHLTMPETPVNTRFVLFV